MGSADSVEGASKPKFVTDMAGCEDDDEMNTVGADDVIRTFDVKKMQCK